MAKMMSKTLFLTYFYLFIYILLSSGVILYNKWVLSPKYFNFPLPITLTMIHMGFSGAVAFFLVRVFKVVSPVKMTFEIYATCVIPISAFFASSLWFGNTAYLHISVAFIQMLKALMPVATFLVAVLCGIDKARCDVFLNMLLVSVGVVVSSYGEIHFNIVGTLYQVTGIFAEAFRLVLTQVLLQKKGLSLNPITSLYYIAPCSFVFLFVPWYLLEKPMMGRSWMYERTLTKKTLQPLFKEGVRGFVAFTMPHYKSDGGIRCPCLKCTCRFYRSPEEIIQHLEKVGFMEQYWVWRHHGEGLPLTNTEVIYDIRAYANKLLTDCGKRPIEPAKRKKSRSHTIRVLTEAESRQYARNPWPIPRVKDSSSAPPLYSTPFPWPIPNPAMVTHGATTSLSMHSPENITTRFSTLPPLTTQRTIMPRLIPDEQQQQREEADGMQQAHQFQEVEKQDGRYVIYPFSDSLMPSTVSAQYIKGAIQACYKKFWPHYGYLKDEDKRDVFDEFRKHCVWEAHHEAEVKYIFHHRARSHLSDMLLDERNTYCGNSDYQPGWIDEEIWNQLLHYWATDVRIKNRPEAGKRIRASTEGGFLHSKGCVSAHTHAGEDVAGKGANNKKYGLGSLAPNTRRRSLFDALDNAEGSSYPPELTPEMHALIQRMTQQLQAQSKQLQTQSQAEKELRDQLHQEVERRRVFEERIEQQFASHNRPPIPSPVEIPPYDSEDEYT